MNLHSTTMMPTNRRRVAATLSLALLVLGLTACHKVTRISTNAVGHPIHVEVTGDHSLESDAERGAIKSPHGTVVIERTRMRVDEADWTAIEASVPIDVQIEPGQVLLTAGRVTVKRTVD
jgi:hypothetical protein